MDIHVDDTGVTIGGEPLDDADEAALLEVLLRRRVSRIGRAWPGPGEWGDDPAATVRYEAEQLAVDLDRMAGRWAELVERGSMQHDLFAMRT